MIADREDVFLLHVSKSLQAWISVEQATYQIYKVLMDGASSAFVSLSFYHNESFHSKIMLIENCFKLCLERDSDEWCGWCDLRKKAVAYNTIRNKLAHQPMKTGCKDGEFFIEISRSFMDVQAITKGEVSDKDGETFKGPILVPGYCPSSVDMAEGQTIDLHNLLEYQSNFKKLSAELYDFSEVAKEMIKKIRKQTKNKT